MRNPGITRADPLRGTFGRPGPWPRARLSLRLSTSPLPFSRCRGVSAMSTQLSDVGTEETVPGTGFTKAHQLFRESVRDFVDREINPYMDEWEEAEIFPAHELFKKAGDLGLLGLSYPEEYGGMGADYWYNMALAEEMA